MLSKNKFRYVILLNFVVYIILLVGRGWGIHRMLNYEETFPVGSALSQNLFLSLNDWSYGILLPRILISIAVKFPLQYLPLILFFMATLLWALFSLIIFWVIFYKTNRYSVATLAGLVLILVPFPQLGMQGIVWNSFWPMFTALTVVVCCGAYGNSKSATIFMSILAFLTAASNPVAAVLLSLIAFDYWQNKIPRQKIKLFASCYIFGLLFSLFVQFHQEPALRYLGEWDQKLTKSSPTFMRLQESGADRVRNVSSPNVSHVINGIPGSIKYLLTQMAPEPFASRWILTENILTNLIHLVLLASILFVVPLVGVLFLRRKSPNSEIPKVIFRFSIVFIIVEAVQIYLIGGVVQTRQLLFVPVCCYWLAIFLLLPRSLTTRSKLQGAVSVGFVFLVGVFGLLTKQNFRDPYSVDGRNRYHHEPLWQVALENSRKKCDELSPNELIIISQNDDVTADAPVIVKCKFIAK